MWTDGQTDRQTDRMTPIYPQAMFAGGIIIVQSNITETKLYNQRLTGACN